VSRVTAKYQITIPVKIRKELGIIPGTEVNIATEGDNRYCQEFYEMLGGKMKVTKKEKEFKVIMEKYSDGYVAYPLGLKGVVVGQGDTYEEALSDVKSAIRFHIETFGEEVLEVEPPILDIFVAETGVEV